MISDKVWSYIAGFWEGEGCAGVWSSAEPRRPSRKRFVVQISQNNPKVLFWIKEQVGYGGVCKKGKRCNQWEIRGGKAKEFLKNIYPFLQFRQDQVLSLIRCPLPLIYTRK